MSGAPSARDRRGTPPVGAPPVPDPVPVPPPPDRTLQLRDAGVDDLPELVRVDREAFPEEPYPYFVLRQWFDAHTGRLIVLADGRQLHAYALYSNPGRGNSSWVISLGVTRDRRGRGLGRLLMGEVLRRLRDEGAPEVRLTVEPANVPAIMLYRSLGFSSGEGIERDYFGPGEHRIVMVLRL